MCAVLQVLWIQELKKVLPAQAGCIVAVVPNQKGETQFLIPFLPLVVVNGSCNLTGQSQPIFSTLNMGRLVLPCWIQ